MDIAARIQQYIVVDTSGADEDTLQCRVGRGNVRTRHFSRQLYREIDQGRIRLPDGTPFDREELQVAFQEAHIAVYGVCILEREYERAGYSDLAALVRNARGADPRPVQP